MQLLEGNADVLSGRFFLSPASLTLMGPVPDVGGMFFNGNSKVEIDRYINSMFCYIFFISTFYLVLT